MNRYLLYIFILFSCNSFSSENNSFSINQLKISGIDGKLVANSKINIYFDYNVDEESLIFIRPTCGYSFEICEGGGGRGSATYLGKGTDQTFIYLTKPTTVTGLQYKIVNKNTKDVIYSGQLPVSLPIKGDN